MDVPNAELEFGDATIEQFLGFMLRERRVAPNTIFAYRSDLTQLQKFRNDYRGAETSCWQDVNRETLQAYISTMQGKDYANATVARKVTVMKSFFRFLTAKGVVASDPAKALSSPRVGKLLPKALRVAEVRELLEQPCALTPKARRDKAMLELLYGTGMRVSELVALDLDSIKLHNNRAWVHCQGKERLLPIREQAVAALHAYLVEARPDLTRLRRSRALFINCRGERLTRQGFWLILKDYARLANIQGAVTAYTLRHSFAKHKLAGGASLTSVQELLGHASISTTQAYTRAPTHVI
ncbi:MAG: tyrosine recombinase [Parcubacteria group bacterium]|nr:tyrosine recombinase [Parcubacteria group bacterium]